MILPEDDLIRDIQIISQGINRMLEIVKEAYQRLLGHGNTRLDAYRCCMFVNGTQCKRVELSYNKIIKHLAVEHGVRRVTKEQLYAQQISKAR